MKAYPNYKCLRCEAYDYCDICPAMMQFVHGNLEYIEDHFCKAAHARYRCYAKGVPAEQVIAEIK